MQARADFDGSFPASDRWQPLHWRQQRRPYGGPALKLLRSFTHIPIRIDESYKKAIALVLMNPFHSQ